MHSLSFVGVGRVGGALALALSKYGYRIDAFVQKRPISVQALKKKFQPSPSVFTPKSNFKIDSEIVFITTPDPEIENACLAIADRLAGKPYVFHTSGSLSSSILAPLKARGCRVGSIHPLASISSAELGADCLSGSYFCVEGDTAAVKLGKKIVDDLCGHAFQIDTKNKTLYHAAAVTACGHLIALIDVAIGMMIKAGVKKADAKKILMPLIRSTVDNLEVQDAAKALTGTFARGDAETFERQLTAFSGNISDQELEIYLDLAGRSLDLTEGHGVDPRNMARMRKRISLAKRKLR